MISPPADLPVLVAAAGAGWEAAALERLDRLPEVERDRRRQQHRLDIGAGQHLVVVLEVLGPAEAGGRLASASRHDVAARD